MAAGAPLAEAARVSQLTRGALYKRAERDPNFAARLEAARARQAAPVETIDWRVIATSLEVQHPERWGAPLDPWEVFRDD